MLAALAAGCGGGDQGERANVSVLPDELLTPPCQTCQPATVQGVAAAGAPFQDAEITVIDSNGMRRATRTDQQGRYLLGVQGMAAPFVIRVSGLLSGQTRTLHTVVLATEVGRALSNITPLTEVLAAQVLQGLPHDLLQDHQADFRRINTRTVRSAHAELERLVRPLLEAAGLPPSTDLRATSFNADHTGMDLALDGLVLTHEGGAYRLRHILNAPAQALTLDPTGTSSTEPLSAPPSPALLQAVHGVAQQINTALSALTALYEVGIPDSSVLTPFMAHDFLSDGLNPANFIAQVWRRQDASSSGGYSLQGARWSDASVLQLVDENNALVALRVTPRPPFAPYTETSWMTRSGGRWLFKGNGRLARVDVRHVSVLGAGVTAYLSFEVDRRRVAAQVARILVKGPGLPQVGLTLAPPTDDRETLKFWSWTGRTSDDWPAVPIGWCPDAGDAELECQESWANVRTGSTYQFTLLDSNNQALETLTASLPNKPLDPGVLQSQVPIWFTRFAADPSDLTWLPTLDHVEKTSPNPYRGDMPLTARLAAATGALSSTESVFELYVETPPTTSTDRAFSRLDSWQSPGSLAAGSFSTLSGGWTAQPSSVLSRWAALRLVSQDAVGNLYVHALSPSHPR